MRDVACGGRAVEAGELEPAAAPYQRSEIVESRVADVAIETALPAASSNHIPQADPGVLEDTQAHAVSERGEVRADRVADQPPELVLRMCVVTTGLERGPAGKTAEDQHAGVAPDDRRQPVQGYHVGIMPNDREERIRAEVRRVPAGHVTTYGAVARRLGACTARMVGAAMASLPDDSGVPWHRVVNGQGKISIPGATGHRQRQLLESEGVAFDAKGRINLAVFGWAAADGILDMLDPPTAS